MSRKTSSEVDESIEQSDRKNERFETVEGKAIEALKHDQLGKSCDITGCAHNREYDSDWSVTDHLLERIVEMKEGIIQYRLVCDVIAERLENDGSTISSCCQSKHDDQ